LGLGIVFHPSHVHIHGQCCIQHFFPLELLPFKRYRSIQKSKGKLKQYNCFQPKNATPFSSMTYHHSLSYHIVISSIARLLSPKI
jgi:hypothetical protein